MPGPSRRSFFQLLGLCIFYGFVLLIVLGLSLWAVGALYFMFPLEGFRWLAAAVYAIAVVGVLFAFRPLWKGALAAIVLFVLVLAWTLTIRPSDDGHWEPDVARTAWADIDGNRVTIHNFRNFDYRTSTDFIPN